MWKRIKRAVKSNIGRLKDDPLSASGPSKRDVAALGESLETVRSQVALLAKDLGKLELEERQLSKQIREALDGGKREVALKHAAVLAKVRDDMQRVKQQLERAREVCSKAESLYGAAGGGASAPGPRYSVSELDAAAEDTLDRLEDELISSGKLATRDGGPAAKTVGDVGETIGEGGTPSSGKTIGGEGRGPDARRAKSAKTIGDAVSTQRAETTGAPEAALAAEGKDPDTLIDELERLGKLKQAGVLTDEEFQAAKRKLLGG